VVAKCLRHVPAQKKELAEVRAGLEKEVIERKVQIEIPVAFAALRKQASPNLFLRRSVTDEELKQTTERLLQETAGLPGKPAGSPLQGN
jgi:hypothetical protein